jgi:hypothetical protein
MMLEGKNLIILLLILVNVPLKVMFFAVSHNVMLGENHIAQLTNFETSRPQSGNTSWPVKDIDEVLRY